MPILTEQDWSAWNEERSNYRKRETSGFLQDIKALEAHIAKLRELCPKDKANWPVTSAVDIIDNHVNELLKVRHYLTQMK